MTRPVIEEGVTEHDWSFFMAEWGRYVAATEIEGEAAIRHLWQCCSEGLRKALHNDGAQGVSDVKVLHARIKSRVVRRRKNLVNVLPLQGMYQKRDEGVQ